MKPLNELCAADAVASLSRRQISAEELTRACLERIYARESQVQAWQFIDSEGALAQARALDAAPRGPLFGLPIGIKDIIDTADLPTEYGSAIYRGYQPMADAACVATLRRSGAVILGKTVTTELAYFTPGKTRNPHNIAHTPGGSSSGSAAAVADFMVPAALGTQTAGSIIRPASFCGVIGYKPTFDGFPMGGIKPLAPSLDTLGFFVRSLSDVQPLSQALCGAPCPIPVQAQSPRIGFCRTEQWPLASADVHRLLLHSVEALTSAGAEIEEVDLGADFGGLLETQKLVMAVETARALKPERDEYGESLSPELQKLFAEADACSLEQYRGALARSYGCRRRITLMFDKFDVLLTPSAAGEALPGLGSTGDPAFNRIWTLLHLPCLNLPVGRGSQALPLGIQLVGAAGGDARMLAVASWIHSTRALAF